MELGARVTCLDVSPVQLEACKSNAPGAEAYDLGSITDLGRYPSNSFDVTLALGGPLSYCGTRDITFTADGKYVAAAYNTPLLINIDSKEKISFVSSGDKKTRLKAEQKGDQVVFSLGALQDNDAPTHRVIPSRAGSLVALGRGWYGKSGFVDVWEVGIMKRLGRYKPKDAGTLTSFSFDNSLLAIEGAEKVTIWKIASGKQIAAVKGDGIMQFSPKSVELAVTDGNRLIIYAPK